MGLIQAAVGSVGGVLADQWKEYFYCDSLDKDALVAKGQKRVSGRSSNTSATDNIISNGSVITVNDGQCMIIVEQGQVVEICAEPGAFTYDSSTEPTVFGGNLASDLVSVLKNMGKRFTFGGDAPKDQRIYYFNTKEIMGNKYGTAQSIQFETMIGTYTLNVNIRCFGEYSYRITNPILFYTNVCGNVEGVYERSEIDSQLKSELLTALQPTFGRIAAKGIRYTQLINYTKDIRNELSEELSEDWSKKRGIEIVSFGVSSVKADEEDEKRIKEIQDSATERRRRRGGGRGAAAGGDAGPPAAGNEAGMGGAFGFMGMGMAGNAGASAMGAFGPQGGMPPQGNPLAGGAAVGGMAAAPAAAAGWSCSCGQSGNTGKFCADCGKPQPAPVNTWNCPCGHTGNTGKFCAECGKPQPSADGWSCICGTTNQGKFCANCGKPKPAGAPLYACDKCGWKPDDPAHPPKFCPQCGDVFDENDKQ